MTKDELKLVRKWLERLERHICTPYPREYGIEFVISDMRMLLKAKA